MAEGLPARRAALTFITYVLQDHLPLDQAFERMCRKYGETLSVQDRAFARYLGTTTLRHLGQIDAMINHCTTRKLFARQNSVRQILRLGISQLLYMAVPAHAAVNGAVLMTGSLRNPRDRHSKGMVNAILRRIDRERDKFSTAFAPTLNIPAWLKQSWLDQFGTETVNAMAESLLVEPPLDISLKPGSDQAWAEKLGGERVAAETVRLSKPGPVMALPGYADGMWWVQDVAASLPVRIMGAGPGDQVLDLCAAPGGKTAQSVAGGCVVTAVDRSPRRLTRLRENMDRLGLSCRIVTADAAAFIPDQDYDYVLLDAPCSSTGTLRRHPDVSRSRGPRDVADLAALQQQLLDHTVEWLPVGAVLVYCVCSLQAEEGPEQIKALLARNRTVKRKPIRPHELPGFERVVLDNGDVRTLPHYGFGDPDKFVGMDGFFISRLIKLSL